MANQVMSNLGSKYPQKSVSELLMMRTRRWLDCITKTVAGLTSH